MTTLHALPGALWRFAWAIFASLTVLTLTACGGGGGDEDPTASAETGSVYLGLTDADGDFLRYEVDVLGIRLERADGTEVDTLPRSTRLDFARYVDLTEFFTSARVPAGHYPRARITLDYTDADVWVDVAGVAQRAVVRDPAGQPLGRYTLDIELEDGNPLVVRPDLPALLTVDFDLAASHQVDVTQDPPAVTAAPLLSANLEPADGKPLRARGPLLAVEASQSRYRIDLRPFHRRDDRFGELTVHTTDATRFEIDGVGYDGAAGLAALAALPAGMPTVAFGTLIAGQPRYTATIVHAGSSVPGVGHDVVIGNVTRREGTTLTVRGALLVPAAGPTRFMDDVHVTLGDGTGVRLHEAPAEPLGIAAISVGQRVEIFGDLDATAAPVPVLDADPGRVRLLPTDLAGLVNGFVAGQLRLDLASIDGRPTSIFDFAGTGLAPATDADPADYEVATGGLDLAHLEPGEPVRVRGHVRPFGEAPDDFDAFTVIDRADGTALLGIGWGPRGTSAPFVSLDAGGLVLDLGNPDIGWRHHLLTGGVLLDLHDLPASPPIVPATAGPTRYVIGSGRSVRVYADFGAFSAALAQRLDGSRRIFALHAQGLYQRDENTLVAPAVAVNLQ